MHSGWHLIPFVNISQPLWRGLWKDELKGIILLPWGGQVLCFLHPGILVTYETAVANCPSCFKHGKSSMLTIPPKQVLISESSGQVCAGNLALCSTGGPWASHLASLGVHILSVNQKYSNSTYPCKAVLGRPSLMQCFAR